MSRYHVPFNLDIEEVTLNQVNLNQTNSRMEIVYAYVSVTGIEDDFKLIAYQDKIAFKHPKLPISLENSIAYDSNKKKHLELDDLLGYQRELSIRRALSHLFKENQIEIETYLSFKDIEDLYFNGRSKFFTYLDKEGNPLPTGFKIKLDGGKEYFKYKNFTLITLYNPEKVRQDTYIHYENGGNDIIAWLDANNHSSKFYQIPKDKKAFKFTYDRRSSHKYRDNHHNAIMKHELSQVSFDELNIEESLFWKKLMDEMLEEFDENPKAFVGEVDDEEKQRENVDLGRYYLGRLPYFGITNHPAVVSGSKTILITFLNKLEKYLMKIID